MYTVRLLKKIKGFTIVEALIFLAVSSILAVSALVIISGQQSRTEFQQAVKEFEAQLRDVANDVSTGYFPNTGTIECQSAAPDATSQVVVGSGAAVDLGTQNRCIVVGRLLDFETDIIRSYTLIGRREIKDSATSPERNVEDIFESRSTVYTDFSETISVGPVFELGKVTFVSSSGPAPREMAGLAFFSSFGKSTLVPQDSGVITADIVPVAVNSGVSTVFTDMKSQYDSFYGSYTNIDLSGNRNIFRNAANRPSGVTFCLLSKTSPRYALVTIGEKAAGASATKLEIVSGEACP